MTWGGDSWRNGDWGNWGDEGDDWGDWESGISLSYSGKQLYGWGSSLHKLFTNIDQISSFLVICSQYLK